MIDELKKLARELKISDLGIVKARVFCDLCLDFDEKEIEEKTNPFLIMPDAKSIIVCLFSYNNNKTGNISKYAMGKDYHAVIKEKLNLLSEPLRDKGYNCEVFSDSWKMNERYLAKEAGLGFIGKNHMLINQEYGSFVFIGAIITNFDLEASKPLTSSCLGCNLCIKNCPGHAIDENGGFSEERCLSYITQKKGSLSPFEIELIKKTGMVWGCDICQNVCLHNKSAKSSEIEEFKTDLITNLKLPCDISNREFKKLYKDRAFSWRGVSLLLRNQQILED